MSLHASPSKSNDASGALWAVAVAFCLLTTATLAAGVAAGGPARDLPAADRTGDALLVVEGSSNGTDHYRIVVDGAVESADEPDAGVEATDEVADARVAGTTNGSDADAYRVSGSITGVVVAGNLTLSLDGQEVSPANLTDGWAVAFGDCATVEVAGNFARGYAFSTVVFPVEGPDGDLAGYEEQPVNEPFDAANRTGSLRAGTTLPENVSDIAALRSVFLYEQGGDDGVDPLLVESEIAARLGEPSVRVENPAHEACRRAIRDRLANGTAGETTIAGDATNRGLRP